MLLRLKNLLLPSVDSILSTFTKTVVALEAKGRVSSELASDYRMKAYDAQEEADRAVKLARKLSDLFEV